MNGIRRSLPYALALAALVSAVAAWCYWWRSGAAAVARYWISPPATKEVVVPVTLTDLGQAGDLFAGFSSLFSALAFVGVVVAAYLQRETIRLQRQQILDAAVDAAAAKVVDREDRKEASVQRARQAFEPLFFQLVHLLREQTRKMQMNVPRDRDEEVDSMHFDAALAALRKRVTRLWGITVVPDVPGQKVEIAAEYYLEFYAANESHLGPYFRTLYHALKLIHRSGLPDGEKVDYANILRGLLSRDELLLVMLNCLSGYGAGLKAYVEIYGVLKHITRGEDGPTTVDQDIAAHSFAPTATMSVLKRKAYWLQHPMPETVDA